ncbi:hypothetical protein L1D34_27595 [Vibrio mediterranei]|uniref:hypothetical protein n=1 Tax=Vibrio mediterranei TaxID=689 RepID=UPI001EFDDFB5|nr:hypothetical protein [Vibrio mediterranei]MCG9628579.1 hypothetical protein [Vibrio mediterranei]
MKKRTITECETDLHALSIADSLESHVIAAMEKIKNMDALALSSKLPKLLMGGGDPFSILGLDPQLFQTIEALTNLNRKAREKLRGRVIAEKDALLDDIEDAEIVSHDNEE